MEVGSDREFALQCCRVRLYNNRNFAREGLPKSLLPAGSRVPKRAVSVQEQSGPGMQGSSSVRVQVVIVLAI